MCSYVYKTIKRAQKRTLKSIITEEAIQISDRHQENIKRKKRKSKKRERQRRKIYGARRNKRGGNEEEAPRHSLKQQKIKENKLDRRQKYSTDGENEKDYLTSLPNP